MTELSKFPSESIFQIPVGDTPLSKESIDFLEKRLNQLILEDVERTGEKNGYDTPTLKIATNGEVIATFNKKYPNLTRNKARLAYDALRRVISELTDVNLPPYAIPGPSEETVRRNAIKFMDQHRCAIARLLMPSKPTKTDLLISKMNTSAEEFPERNKEVFQRLSDILKEKRQDFISNLKTSVAQDSAYKESVEKEDRQKIQISDISISFLEFYHPDQGTNAIGFMINGDFAILELKGDSAVLTVQDNMYTTTIIRCPKGDSIELINHLAGIRFACVDEKAHIQAASGKNFTTTRRQLRAPNVTYKLAK